MNPVEAVLAFLDAINGRDVERIVALVSEDHAFIDSLGHAIRGREAVRNGWQGYYGMCPDYWVSHEAIFAQDNDVAVFGGAGGTIKGTKWEIPAAWKAVVKAGKVQEWRVYADNKPVYEILAK